MLFSSPALTLSLSSSLSLPLSLISVSGLVCCSWVQSGPLRASSASSGPSPLSLCSKYLWQPHTFLNATVILLSSQYGDQKKALLTSNSKPDKYTPSLEHLLGLLLFPVEVSLYLLNSYTYNSAACTVHYCWSRRRLVAQVDTWQTKGLFCVSSPIEKL